MPYEGFTSPGAAVANTLADILTQKRLESRQAMIDRLNEENIRSQMADRETNRKIQEENAKTNAARYAAESEQWKANAAERNERMFGEKLKNLGLQQGDDLSQLATTNPDLYNELKQRMYVTETTPSVQTNTELPPGPWAGQYGTGAPPSLDPDQSFSMPESSGPMSKLFRGTRDEREETDQRSRLTALANSPEFQKANPTNRYLMARAIDPKIPANASWLANPEDVEAQLQTFDEVIGKYKGATDEAGKPIMGKKGERPVIWTRPPQAPTPANAQLYRDEKTNQWWAYDGKTRAWEPVASPKGQEPPNPSTTNRPPTATGVKPQTFEIKQTDLAPLRQARLDVVKARNSKDRGAAEASRVSAYTALINNKAPIGIRDALHNILRNPTVKDVKTGKQYQPWGNVTEEYLTTTANPPLAEDEKNALHVLLPIIRGEFE